MLAASTPIFLALSAWMIVACLTYLQAPPGYGGATLDASGRLVLGPKKPDLLTPLILSAVTVPFAIGWVVLLGMWKRAPEEVVVRQAVRTRKTGTRPARP